MAQQILEWCAFMFPQGTEIPMDFDPEEADEISEEIRLAAQATRKVTKKASFHIFGSVCVSNLLQADFAIDFVFFSSCCDNLFSGASRNEAS